MKCRFFLITLAALLTSYSVWAADEEALVVLETGDVGVNISQPEARLHVVGDINPVLFRFDHPDSLSGAGLTMDADAGQGLVNLVAGAQIKPDGTGYNYLGTHGASRIRLGDGRIDFYTGYLTPVPGNTVYGFTSDSSEALTISAYNQVGIATPTPVGQLTIRDRVINGNPALSSALNAITIDTKYENEEDWPGIVWNTYNNYSGTPKLGIWGWGYNNSYNMYLGAADSNGSGISRTLTIGSDGASVGGNFSITKILTLIDEPAPTSSISYGIKMWSQNGELRVRDAYNNITVLSNHRIDLFEPDEDDSYPVIYFAENAAIGERVNAYLSRALSDLEKITGKKYLYREKIPTIDAVRPQRKQWVEDWIAKNTREIEIPKDEAFGDFSVEVEDKNVVVDERVRFELKGEEVLEIREPVYGTKIRSERRLRKDVRFDTTNGRFYRKIIPGKDEAEAAAAKEFKFKAPDWIQQRMAKRLGNTSS